MDGLDWTLMGRIGTLHKCDFFLPQKSIVLVSTINVQYQTIFVITKQKPGKYKYKK